MPTNPLQKVPTLFYSHNFFFLW